MVEPVIIVHGGAWSIPDNRVTVVRRRVKSAAQAGYKVLQKCDTAVDAVQTALMVMEDDPNVDAGKGSVLITKGEVEMDAVIMDGSTLKTGAVACVQNTKNPIVLARTVMEKTEHNLLVGQGANLFAEQHQIQRVSTDSLVAEQAQKEYSEFKEKGGYRGAIGNLFKGRFNNCYTTGLELLGDKMNSTTSLSPDLKDGIDIAFRTSMESNIYLDLLISNKHDTVGAVALDSKGNTAYGTSTGDITYKMPGRVGDSPIIGIPAQDAVDKALDTMAKRVNGYGGIIVLSNKGDAVRSFTTERMAWAFIKKDLLHFGINVGENCTERAE